MDNSSQETEVDRLRDIMGSMPENANFESSLTRGDVMLIYRIARVANTPHVCPFEKDDIETLQSTAKNLNNTHKIASYVIIVALVGGAIGGIWKALVLLATDFIKQP